MSAGQVPGRKETPGDVTVAIVGVGRLGQLIAGELARLGFKILLYDHTEHGRQRAVTLIQAGLAEWTMRGLLPQSDAENALKRLRVVGTLQEAAQAHLVVEAIVEDVKVKQRVFWELDVHAPPSTLLATSTITLDVNEIFNPDPRNLGQAALPGGIRNSRMIGMRFLHPVYFIPNVELTVASCTSQSSLERARQILRLANKEPFEFVYGQGMRKRLDLIEMQNHFRDQREKVRTTSINQGLPPPTIPDQPQYQYSGHPLDPDVLVGMVPAAPAQTSGGATRSTQAVGDEEGECSICCARPKNAVFGPCGHKACYECSWEIMARHRACPECRTPIEQVLRLFQ